MIYGHEFYPLLSYYKLVCIHNILHLFHYYQSEQHAFLFKTNHPVLLNYFPPSRPLPTAFQGVFLSFLSLLSFSICKDKVSKNVYTFHKMQGGQK